MGFKSGLKKFWLGLQAAAPSIEALATLVPGGGPVALGLRALMQVITNAEVMYPQQGSGSEKAHYFTITGMKVLEAVTGKNVDSPEGRALLAELAAAEVAARNAQTRIKAVVEQLDDYIRSAKEPAKPDTN